MFRKESTEDYFSREIQKAQLENEQLKTQNALLGMNQQQNLNQEQEEGMIKQQLSLGDELKVIDYLLRSYTLITDENGSRWQKPEHEDMIILSDYGVHFFREAIAWYLNKNTLLSAYEPEEILIKMQDFANALNDAIFLEYELIFNMPSFERCVKELKERIDSKIKLRMFASKLMGKEINEEDVTKELLHEFEGKVEKELTKIKQQLMKNKYKRFGTLLRFIQDTVHSAYNRAAGGQERRSLRQHMQITETKGSMQGINPISNKKGFFSCGSNK